MTARPDRTSSVVTNDIAKETRRTRRVSDATLPDRLRALFGEKKLTPRLMTALDRGHTSVEAIMAGKHVPHELLMIVELLEVLPVLAWPQRWLDARSDGHVMIAKRRRTKRRWRDCEGAVVSARDALLNGATYAAAAHISGINKNTLYSLTRQGRLPSSFIKRPRRSKASPPETH